MVSSSVPPVRLRLIGAVTAEGPAGEVAFSSPMVRTLLALLAVGAGGAVTTRALIDEIWGEELPTRAAEALQVLVSRLRGRRRTRGRGSIGPIGETYRLDLPATPSTCTASTTTPPRPSPPTRRARPCSSAAHGRSRRGAASRSPGRRWASASRSSGCAPSTAACASSSGWAPRCWTSTARRRPSSSSSPTSAADRSRERLPSSPRPACTGRAARARPSRSSRPPAAACATSYDVEPGPEIEDLTLRLLAPTPARQPRPTLVGREEELAAVRALLEAPEAGAIRLITGEAGIGKTALLRAARREAWMRGAAVGGGSCDVDAPPWAAWAEALAELGAAPVAPGEPAPGRALLDRLTARPGPGAADPRRRSTSPTPRRSPRCAASPASACPPGWSLLVAAREPDAQAHPIWGGTHAELALLDVRQRRAPAASSTPPRCAGWSSGTCPGSRPTGPRASPRPCASAPAGTPCTSPR